VEIKDARREEEEGVGSNANGGHCVVFLGIWQLCQPDFCPGGAPYNDLSPVFTWRH